MRRSNYACAKDLQKARHRISKRLERLLGHSASRQAVRQFILRKIGSQRKFQKRQLPRRGRLALPSPSGAGDPGSAPPSGIVCLEAQPSGGRTHPLLLHRRLNQSSRLGAVPIGFAGEAGEFFAFPVIEDGGWEAASL